MGSSLIFTGGAVGRTQYADYPSKVYTLNVSSPVEWKDDLIPPLLGERKWHGCTLANLRNEVSFFSQTQYISKYFLVVDQHGCSWWLL